MKKLDSLEVFLVELQEIAENYSKVRDYLRNPGSTSLDDEKINALKQCEFTDEGLNAIESIVRERMSEAFFEMVGLLDGIGDPKVVKGDRTWVGLRLKEPKEDDEAQYLNEQFYESYDNWLELKKENL
ncbi:hypothetical protein [Priestia megaterium]|uniref:Uncharacterized protein n=1 Tax=Priestia megaterium TaxID=1404 RepID=A0A6M6DZF5_PRIMG|nr:hypothetical protein [Priestia megaterium]QJX80152.1 hypothetical protein FDZ14_29080 [Priestia megaterium]